MTKLSDIRFAVIDTETGQNISAFDKISKKPISESMDPIALHKSEGIMHDGGNVFELVEIGMYCGKITDASKDLPDQPQPSHPHVIGKNHFWARMKPSLPIPPECSAAHGFRDADLIGYPDYREAIEKFVYLSENTPWLIHNAAFDWPILQWHATQVGLKLKPTVVIDTLRLARLLMPLRKSHKEHVLVELFGVPRLAAHLALTDCAMLMGVFAKLVEIYLALGYEDSLEGLCGFLYQPLVRIEMPFGKHKGKRIDELPPDYLSWWLEKRIVEDYEREDWDLNYSLALAYADCGGSSTHLAYMKERVTSSFAWPHKVGK
jgi:DNA polymerase III epsilon subunit-like protein